MEQAGLARGGGGGGGGDGVDWGHPFWISDSFLADKGLRSHPADPEVGLTSRDEQGGTPVQQKAGSSKRTQPRKAGVQWGWPLSIKLWR